MLVSKNAQLNILVAQNSNKVAKEVLKEADVKTLLTQNKDLNASTLLKSLFNSINQESKTNETVLNLLKNSQLSKNLGSFTSNLQTLEKLLPSSKEPVDLKALIQNFLVDIKKASPSNVKTQVQNSGIFLEAKLFEKLQSSTQNVNLLKNDSFILNDMKSILLKIQEQFTKALTQSIENSEESSNSKEILKNVDKLLMQVDYHQLYSMANDSKNVYIPFLWDFLEDGNIDIKQLEDEKFYCKIDLELKELGKIEVHLFLIQDDKLDINIFTNNELTKQLLRENSTKLKQELNDSSLQIIGLSIQSLIEDEEKEKRKENIYNNSDDINFGVNIKV